MPVTCLILNHNLVNKRTFWAGGIYGFYTLKSKATDLDGWVYKIRQLIS